MWSRKRLDIGWFDMAAAKWNCLLRWRRGASERALLQTWSGEMHDDNALSCLSVRSGWDLLLQSLQLPAGSEVLMSALTIPDMAAIVEHHGLVPVPLDLDPATMAPTADSIRRLATDKTKIVLLAHLFGSRMDLDPLIAAARENGLLVIEDCAQAYVGPAYAGHPDADVKLFSFGTIKTNTALGGAILSVADDSVREQMQQRQAEYPLQSRFKYFQRVLKYGAMKAISPRWIYGGLIRCCGWLGKDYDRILNSAVRGFPGSGVERFRTRPSAPLMATMRRRFRRFHPQRIEWQTHLGRRLTAQIADEVSVLGTAAAHHHYWVYPVLTEQPAEMISALRQAGFDATQGQSLCVVSTPTDRPDVTTAEAERMLREIVYLPMYPALTEAAVDRMAEVLLQVVRSESANIDADLEHIAG